MKILIADDHELILEGFSMLLRQLPEIREVFTVRSKSELFEMLSQQEVDVLFQDIKFGSHDARDFIGEILERFPAMKVIMLSSLSDKFVYESLFKQGVHGYVVKSAPKKTLYESIAKVRNGQLYISEELMQLNGTSRIKTESIPITVREKDVLKLIMKELTIKEIASAMFLSEKTIEVHRSRLFQKFGVKNLAGLVKQAILNGYM